MRTTIDQAGRLVVPKALREELGIRGGDELELRVRDGVLEAEPAGCVMRLVEPGGFPFIEADQEMAPLSADEVRILVERQRR